MKWKKLIPLFFLLNAHVVFTLQINSNANGVLLVSEPQLRVGDNAPKISLTTADNRKVIVGGSTGKVQIISTIDSFNKPVSDKQTKQLSTVAKYLKKLQIYVVTANPPDIIASFIVKHKINNIQLLSSINDRSFAKAYGVQILNGELKNLMARSIFVVDKNGKIVYKEIVPNLDQLPNIRKAAITAAGEIDK